MLTYIFNMKHLIIFVSLLILFYSCEKEPDIPTGLTNKIELKVITDDVFRIDSTGIAIGTIENLGYLKALINHGFCWSTSPAPDTNQSKLSLGPINSLGSFSGMLSGMDLNTTYYIRSFIANQTHVAYGDEFVINAVCGGETEISFEGQSYKIVAIGNQCWMAKNLNAGTYVESTLTYFPSTNVNNNGFVEKYCYNNLTANCDIYGGLYDWNEMMQYSNTAGTKGICPNGWHIPTNQEWTALTNYLGGHSVAGAKLKPNTPYQFDALMGGYRLSNGSFADINNGTRFWSSSTNAEGLPFYVYLMENSSVLLSKNYHKNGAFSVRCIKNQ